MSEPTRLRRRWDVGGGCHRWLTILLVVALVAGYAFSASPARADGPLITPSPPDLLNDAELLDSTGLYYATPAEFPALDALQQQAITNTLADHALPSAEAMAVQGWARDDAEAELYALLVQAASTAACSATQTPGNNCRTANQQNAVQWLADMAQREGVQAAYYAGLEYVKWAGLSQASYNSDVNAYKADLSAGKDTSTDKTNLENFLKQGFTAPADYSCADGTIHCIDTTSLSTIQATATEGFCIYQSPTPYQSDYQGNIFSGTDASMPAICDEPGGGIGCLIDCNPDTPAYGDFVRWGEADANFKLVDTYNYTETAHDIALGIGLGGVTVAVATGVTLGATLGSVMGATAAGTAFVSAVFPNAGFVTGLTAATYAATSSAAGASTSAAAASASAGAVGAAGIGIIAGAVLLFVAGTTAEVIQLVADSQLPGQVATLLEDSPTQGYDPGSMVGDQNGGAGELYSLFVNATLPLPLTNCTQYTPVSNPVCLDPPPPAAPDLLNDPEFSVSENGATATTQPTITWYDKTSQVTAQARVHETWFLEQATDNQGNPLQVTDNDGVTRAQTQTLRIVYTDWNGNEQTAELVNDPTLGYEFASVQLQSGGTVLKPSTCLTSKTCAYSATINYVDSAGNKYTASLVKPVFPTVTTPTWTPQNPLEGQAVKLQSTVGPSSGSFTTTWTIQDKPLNPPFVICGTPTAPAPCPPPTVSVSGNPATYTFPTSGSFTVTVTASDSVGRSASSTVTVNVGDVAPQVNPYHACTPSLFTQCLIPYNLPNVTPGSQTTLGGTLVHAGSEDVESLDINWGDSTTDDTNSNQCAGSPFANLCDPNLNFDLAHQSVSSNGAITLPFTATHTYANPGTYTVTLTDTDQSGTKAKTTFTESALYTTATTVSPSSVNPSVYGQQVTLTTTVSATGTSTGPTGTVTFYDGATTLGTGSLSTSNGVTTATLTVSNLPVGAQTITAAYGGDGGKAFLASATLQGYTQAVNQAATSASISSLPASSVWGQSVTFTATVHVTSPGAGNPSGTVDFKDGSGDISGCHAQSVDTTSETATCTTSALSVASHSVTATYSGDGNFTGSTTSADTQVVNKANSSATVSSSSGIVTKGQSLTFSAPVAAVGPGAGTPTGTVTFYDGSTSIGTGSLSASSGTDQATFSTTGLAVGAHAISVAYGGDGNFNASPRSASITVYINTNLSSYPLLAGGGPCAYNLSNANLSGGYFVGLCLQGASLTGANLSNAVFTGANLTSANLSNSNLMSNANFTNANLTNANLSNSNLKGANFSGANLSGANLTNSNLKGATGLNTATLTGVVWNKTECPDGTLSNTDGGTCIGHL